MSRLAEIIITIVILGSFSFLIGLATYYIIQIISEILCFKKAYNLLSKGQKQQTLNEEEVLFIYNQTFKGCNKDSYDTFLEKILIRVRENDSDGKATSNFNTLLKPIIKKEKEDKPYLKVDEKERRVIQAIEDAAKNSENNSLRKNLIDLSSMIIDKQNSLKNSHRVNRLSIPISIIGILTTILIWQYGSSLSEEDVDRISAKTSEIILKENKQLFDEAKLSHMTPNENISDENQNPNFMQADSL